MSCERTFEPTASRDFLLSKCRELAVALADDMLEHQVKGRTVTVKLKTNEFEVRTRSITLRRNVTSAEDLFEHASQVGTLVPYVIFDHVSTSCTSFQLLEAELPVCLRLLGVRISHLHGLDEPDTEDGRSILDFWKDKSKEPLGNEVCEGLYCVLASFSVY